MPSDLRDIVATSICKFNCVIDIDGSLVPDISKECCEQPCGYCRIAADYICKQIEEDRNDQ